MTLPTRPNAQWDELPVRLGGQGHYLDDFLGDLKRQAYLTLIARWGDGREKGRLLKTDLYEEACGPDHFLGALAEDAEQIVGFDVSLAVAHQARRRHPEIGDSMIVADVRRLPFAERCFDLVVSASTLDHFPKPEDLGVSLIQLGRVLKDTGRIIVTLDNRGNVFDPLLRLAKLLGRIPFYLGRSYRISELVDELQAAGLECLDRGAIVHSPRLVPTGVLWLSRRLRWPGLRRLLHRSMVRMQTLEHSRWRYLSGSFVAAVAARRDSPAGPLPSPTGAQPLIRQDDLRGNQILALLQEHLRNMTAITPAGSVHALDVDALRAPGVTFWTAWDGQELLACGALKALSSTQGEVKSMRTAEAHRGRGVGAAMLRHLIDEARRRGYQTLSLETGSYSAFEPARRLYRRFGFELCEPFGDYRPDPNSVFMTRRL